MADTGILLIDIGNSVVKFALMGESGHLENTVRVPIRNSDFHSALNNYFYTMEKPKQVFACSVGNSETLAIIIEFIEQAFGMSVTRIRSIESACGIRNCYTDSGALGADRWCAMIAAYHMHGGVCCVVDAGSAVTIDGVSSHGDFKGGAILPGWTAWRTSLGRSVGLNSDRERVTERAGCSTELCISAGFINSVVGAIKLLIQQFSIDEKDKPMIFLTGGDAEMIAKYIDLPYRHEPELVLHGLARIGKTLT